MIQKINSNFGNVSLPKIQQRKIFTHSVPFKQLQMDTVSFGNHSKRKTEEVEKPRIVATPMEKIDIPADYRVVDGVVRDQDGISGIPQWTPNSVEHIKNFYRKFNPSEHKGLYPIRLKSGSSVYRVGMYDPAHTEVFTFADKGYFYVNQLGQVTRFDKDVDEFAPDVFLGMPTEDVIDDFKYKDEGLRTKAIDALIRTGRMSEIMDYVAQEDYSGIMDSIKALGFNEEGEYDRDLKIDISATPSFHYDKKVEEIDKEMRASIEEAPSKAEGWQPSGSDRAYNFFMTLGVSEIVRAVKKNSDTKRYVAYAEKRAQESKERLNQEYAQHQAQITDKLTRTEQAVADFQVLKAKKSQTQKEVRAIFNTFAQRSNNMPRSVAFVGENNVMAKEFAKTSADEMGADFCVVKYTTKHGSVISDLMSQVHALQSRKPSDKKAILYVENIDTLIDDRLSDDKQIKEIHDTLEKTNSRFTVMFDTKDPDRLHRVLNLSSNGHYEVKIPATFEEANFSQRIK